MLNKTMDSFQERPKIDRTIINDKDRIFHFNKWSKMEARNEPTSFWRDIGIYFPIITTKI